MSEKMIFCIVNVDSWPGYAMACRFLQGQVELRAHFRLLCHRREGLDELERMGGEVREVNYEDENDVRQAVQGARVVMLVPLTSQRCQEQGELVMRASQEENVEHVSMLSV